MKSNDKQWKAMKINEKHWEALKSNEKQWKALKRNEKSWTAMKSNEKQWKTMRRSEKRSKAMKSYKRNVKSKEKQGKALKRIGKPKKNMEKQNWKFGGLPPPFFPYTARGDIFCSWRSAKRETLSRGVQNAILARPEIFEFCVAGGHAKFEKFGPSVTTTRCEINCSFLDALFHPRLYNVEDGGSDRKNDHWHTCVNIVKRCMGVVLKTTVNFAPCGSAAPTGFPSSGGQPVFDRFFERTATPTQRFGSTSEHSNII